jgi:hypothetical protein
MRKKKVFIKRLNITLKDKRKSQTDHSQKRKMKEKQQTAVGIWKSLCAPHACVSCLGFQQDMMLAIPCFEC